MSAHVRSVRGQTASLKAERISSLDVAAEQSTTTLFASAPVQVQGRMSPGSGQGLCPGVPGMEARRIKRGKKNAEDSHIMASEDRSEWRTGVHIRLHIENAPSFPAEDVKDCSCQVGYRGKITRDCKGERDRGE